MHATLTGLGVGSDSATALSATLSLMLKEGASHIASLGFAFAVASQLDGEVRFWRLAADVANDVGLTLELAAPLGGAALFLPLTCAANMCKAVCGVAAGATRVAISAHFARGHNGALVAEVAAKEGTQETAVTLVGLVLGMLLAPALNASPAVQWASFAILTIVHVVANTAAVRCLALRTLSRTRALLLLEASATAASSSGGASPSEPPAVAPAAAAPTPQSLREAEPLLPVQYTPRAFLRSGLGNEGGALHLGCSLEDLRRAALACFPPSPRSTLPWEENVTLLCPRLPRLKTLGDALRGAEGGSAEDFCLVLTSKASGEAWVAFSGGASPRTCLKGWLAAVSELREGLGGMTDLQVEKMFRQWEAAGWDLATPALEEQGYRVLLEKKKED